MPLTAIDPLWINASAGSPSYDAEELRRDLGYLLTGGNDAGQSRSGVLDPRALLPYLSGNDVWVPVGGAALGTLKGSYVTGNKVAAKVETLAAADATNPRRDRIVLVVLDPDNGSTSSTSRTAEFRVITGTPSATAPTGGGYPAEPTAPNVAACLTLGWVDVPKSGAGSPTVTDQRVSTAAAGAPVLVKSATELSGLPVWEGRQAIAAYLPGYPTLTVSDGVWKANTIQFFGSSGAYVVNNPPVGAQILMQTGTLVQSTDVSGYAAIGFPRAFPNGVISVQVSSGDASVDSARGSALTMPIAGAPDWPTPVTLTRATYALMRSNGTRLSSTTHRANWIAYGW